MLHARLVTDRERLRVSPVYALLSEEGGDSIRIGAVPTATPFPNTNAPLPAEETKLVITISFARGANPSVSTPTWNY